MLSLQTQLWDKSVKTFELVIPSGTAEDYEWAKKAYEDAWFNVGQDPDGHVWVSGYVVGA
jgi:hypothetical protein